MELDLFLQQAVLVLASAVAVMLVCHRLRVPPLVGLLLTGMLIGPSGLGLASRLDVIHLLAEIGVVLLLFAIGLELSLGKLAEVRRPFLLGGSLQALLAGGVAAVVARALGVAPGRALFVGMVIVLSSTALVLKLLGDRRETETPHGKLALAILLFQDFLVVPMVVLTPVLAGEVAASPATLAGRFVGSLLAVVAVVLVARRLMPRLVRMLADTRVRELFVLGAVGICLAMAGLTHALGFSLALGAFIAGLLISETDYGHQVFTDIAPLRDLFSSLFFISIGMLVDLRFVALHPLAVVTLAVAVVFGKALAGGLAVAALRYPLRTAVLVALSLAQIGEFSFVLMEVGREHGLLQPDRYQLLLAAAVLSLLATPGLMRLAPVVGEGIGRAWSRVPGAARAARAVRAARALRLGATEVVAARSDHVVLVGFGVGGRLLARVLREVRIPYVVIELGGETVGRARAEGEPILYGDASRREILEHAGVERARALVFLITDPPAVLRAVKLARDLKPDLEIVVRSRTVREIEPLRAAGADQVVAEEFETAIEIFTRVLARFHVPRHVVRAQTRALRGEGYRMLRSESLREEVSEAVAAALAAGATDVFRVEGGNAAAGATLRELDLRRRCGASVIAVVRDGMPLPNPSPELALAPGDDLVLVGSHAQVDRAFALLGAARSESAAQRTAAAPESDRDDMPS